MKKQILSALIALGLTTLPAMAQQQSDVMVVFDASGSMWGQIDGRTKIEIARDAFADLSYEWAASGVNVGLIAYGHRRKGDCGDIELIAEPAPGSTARLGELLQTLTPRGKTPLSDAVRLAAQTLKFTENAATVVLISDGRETCGVKVCEAATELERLGVNFTANVIGFGVDDAEAREQLQCLAQNTGGQYFDAKNAGALADALGQVTALDTSVAQVQETTMPMVALNVGIIEADGTARPVQISFRATNLDTGEGIELGGLRDAREVVSGLSGELPEGR
ncbi:MAG: VWA domain-containing protein, partial [Devosiaceae bacterium]|nr:VWA domain-containing protein [Devosiaceae bacterium]